MKISVSKRVMHIIRRLIYRYKGLSKYCIFCDSKIGGFLPCRDGVIPPLMFALDCIGSDVTAF
jgi:hypothetical protein